MKKRAFYKTIFSQFASGDILCSTYKMFACPLDVHTTWSDPLNQDLLRLLAYLKKLICINWLVMCTWLKSLPNVLTWYYPIISMTPNWLFWHVIFRYELSNVTRASLTPHHTQDKITEHAKSSCCCRMTTIDTELQYLKIF